MGGRKCINEYLFNYTVIPLDVVRIIFTYLLTPYHVAIFLNKNFRGGSHAWVLKKLFSRPGTHFRYRFTRYRYVFTSGMSVESLEVSLSDAVPRFTTTRALINSRGTSIYVCTNNDGTTDYEFGPFNKITPDVFRSSRKAINIVASQCATDTPRMRVATSEQMSIVATVAYFMKKYEHRETYVYTTENLKMLYVPEHVMRTYHTADFFNMCEGNIDPRW